MQHLKMAWSRVRGYYAVVCTPSSFHISLSALRAEVVVNSSSLHSLENLSVAVCCTGTLPGGDSVRRMGA